MSLRVAVTTDIESMHRIRLAVLEIGFAPGHWFNPMIIGACSRQMAEGGSMSSIARLLASRLPIALDEISGRCLWRPNTKVVVSDEPCTMQWSIGSLWPRLGAFG